MNMPGFAAEGSLDKTRVHYRMNATQLVGAVEVNIVPQLKIVAGSPRGGELNSICGQIGEIVDQFYQDSIDPNNSASEQQDARNTANQMYNRSKGTCSFGVQR